MLLGTCASYCLSERRRLTCSHLPCGSNMQKKDRLYRIRPGNITPRETSTYLGLIKVDVKDGL